MEARPYRKPVRLGRIGAAVTVGVGTNRLPACPKGRGIVMRIRWPILVVLALGLVAAPSAGAQSAARDGIKALPHRHVVPWAAPQAGVCLRFDDLPAGSALTTYHSVVFTNTDGGLTVQDAYPGAPFSSPNAILPDNYSVPGNSSTAKPPVLVRRAAVTMGDYDADQDNVFLNAYDSNGGLVASDTDVVPASLSGGVILTVSSTTANIASITFWGVGGSENSVYFDNVCFAK
jgi:hypothetical protein